MTDEPPLNELKMTAGHEGLDGEPAAPVQDPSTEPMLQFFAFEHLPAHLAAVSGDFFSLACSIIATLPRNPERTVALRKLLEAKDCAVRAVLYK